MPTGLVGSAAPFRRLSKTMPALRALGLTQQAAARRMGIAQPKGSGVMPGDFTHLSERRLMDCLNRLGTGVRWGVTTQVGWRSRER